MPEKRLISDQLIEMGVSFPPTVDQKFTLYKNLLHRWNQKYNLTRIESEQGVFFEHFYDSVIIYKYESICHDGSTLDLGTGGGLPGIPMKLVQPQMSMVLLDSQFKKIWFLRKVIRELALENIHLCHGRAEDMGREPSHRGRYDVIVSRALSSLPVLIEYALPFLRLNGKFVAWKTKEQLDNELKRCKIGLKHLGGKLKNIHYYHVPTLDQERSLVVIEKTLETPEMYPRKPGKPEKTPLA